MGSKTAVGRALTAFIARQALRIATIIALGVALVLFVIIWLLAANFSGWWWVLAVPLGAALLVALLLRWILSGIIRSIYRPTLSTEQRTSLKNFSDKLLRLFEAKSISLPFIMFRTLWDVFRHRDAVTIRRILEDSTSLKRDFSELEQQFR